MENSPDVSNLENAREKLLLNLGHYSGKSWLERNNPHDNFSNVSEGSYILPLILLLLIRRNIPEIEVIIDRMLNRLNPALMNCSASQHYDTQKL